MSNEAIETQEAVLEGIGSDYESKYGFSVPENYVYKSGQGLTREVVEDISQMKNEPAWMREFRLKSLAVWHKKPLPWWGVPELAELDFDSIHYYVRPLDQKSTSWDEVPAEIKDTFDRLGIPEAERKYLAGVSAQFESEVVYHSMNADLAKQGVIFLDTDSAVREYPDLVKEYFGTVVPPSDNKFAALNSAVWSGGTFIYVPKGVHVEIPLQAYFRINAENMGQFERTLIIVDEGAYVHYVEGCTAPVYSSNSLHSAVVEIIVKKGGRCRYSTIQNWSTNVFNLVTKRAMVYEDATMEWIDGNLGSKVTMKYPAVFLAGPGARGEVVSIAFAGPGQHQDAGAKMVHLAPNTSSLINSKSISKGGGRTTYRGLVRVNKACDQSKVNVECDALVFGPDSASDTIPYIEVMAEQVAIQHEAKVSKVSEDQLFYLMSRGLSESQAMQMIVQGFIEPFTRELPMEYAIEMNRLLQLEMEGSVG